MNKGCSTRCMMMVIHISLVFVHTPAIPPLPDNVEDLLDHRSPPVFVRLQTVAGGSACWHWSDCSAGAPSARVEIAPYGRRTAHPRCLRRTDRTSCATIGGRSERLVQETGVGEKRREGREKRRQRGEAEERSQPMRPGQRQSRTFLRVVT